VRIVLDPAARSVSRQSLPATADGSWRQRQARWRGWKVGLIESVNGRPGRICDHSNVANLDPDVVVRFGGVEIRSGLVGVSTSRLANQIGTATVVLDPTVASFDGVDWQAAIQILAHGTPIFTGVVDRVEVDEQVTVRAVDGAQELSELRMGGMANRGMSPQELIWSIVRSAGLPAERIDVGDWPRPLERFTVSVPLEGAQLLAARSVAGVAFAGQGRVRQSARRLFGSDPAELVERYEGVAAWAQTTCEATTVLDAETLGLRLVDVATAWMMLLSQFSAPRLLDGSLRSYRRSWTQSQLRRADVVLVEGTRSGRAWLRVPTDLPNIPELNLEECDELSVPPFPDAPTAQIREAVLAWRRAREHPDPIGAIIAFWEAMEFYVSGVSVDAVFDKAELATIRARLPHFDDNQKRQRVDQAIADLNNAPLLARLREALASDGVPCTEYEFEIILEMRKARNDFAHGRVPRIPDLPARKLAIALLGRMLAYRVARLAELPR
jgi:hypothetical protein